MMYQVETKAELTSAIFKLLSRTLQVQNFVNLEPEAQRLTLEEARCLLFDGTVPMVNKRAIVAYLSVFTVEQVGAEVMAIVAIIFQEWHDAPF